MVAVPYFDRFCGLILMESERLNIMCVVNTSQYSVVIHVATFIAELSLYTDEFERKFQTAS
jgi:hypothetical protein